MKIARWNAVFLILTLLLTACSGTAGGISVEGAWVRQVPVDGLQGVNTAGFMVIKNNGQAADRLIGAESTAAKTVEIHETSMTGDIMSMRPVNAIEISAGGEVEFKPGGYHLMLIEVLHPLETGDEVEITLRFETAGQMKVKAKLKE